MAIYVMLTTLTDEGRKTIKQNPQRIQEVNKAVSRVAVELGSRGTLDTMTMVAMTVDELVG